MLKKYKYPFLLTLLLTLLLFTYIPQNYIFGSNTDWLSQHVSIAEYLRTDFYTNKKILPDYSFLGAGSNIYMFAYYGILRPDILIGYAFPTISMKVIIICYAIFSMYVSMILCFFWIKKHSKNEYISFICSILFICANCFFQAHRQLMFINYMPFLILLLLAIDLHTVKSSKILMILSFFLILLHSFFFSISCFIVGLLYLIYKKGSIQNYIYCFILAVGMCSVILLPTFLVILENKKDAGDTSLISLFCIQPALNNLLYSPYGCGLTCISLYSFVNGIKQKETRLLSISIFILFLFTIFSFLLNGFLYIRSKIYIPFLPLIILLCANTLKEHRNKKLANSLIVLLLLFILPFQNTYKTLFLFDYILLICFLLIHQKTKWSYLLLCVIPIINSIQTNQNDNYVLANDHRQDRFTQEELTNFYQDNNYRFDFINDNLTNSNFYPVKAMKKTTMYSSTMNTLYSTFYYDIMKNPISINNRVALLANQNPFFAYLMSIQYIQTSQNEIPNGYQIINQKDEYVLAENENVLPIAYASSTLLNEEIFDMIAFPYYLDVITNQTIVQNTTTIDYTSNIKKIDVQLDDYISDIDYTKQDNNQISFNLKKTTTLEIPLEQSLTNSIMIISFTIENPDNQALTIKINQIQNKLSSSNASYPNHNHQFVYMISNNQTINSLTIELSKGMYTISDLEVYTVPMESIGQSQTYPLQLKDTSQNQIINGYLNWNNDGYFVTSLPYQNGYHAYVNGEEVAIEITNKAFVGFALEKGEYEIIITFEAPGKKISIYITSISWLILSYLIYKERRQAHAI